MNSPLLQEGSNEWDDRVVIEEEQNIGESKQQPQPQPPHQQPALTTTIKTKIRKRLKDNIYETNIWFFPDMFSQRKLTNDVNIQKETLALALEICIDDFFHLLYN